MSRQNGKLKLMVVDDEPDNLDLLYRTFRREFEVLRAESGYSALAQLETVGEVAVIISDQRMPGISGIEFLSRTVPKFPDTIRIVLTGYTDVEDLVEAINSGKVFKYITKPWDPEELRVVVRQASETYRVLKQRTEELSRALQREYLLNAITTAIRESLDYTSILQTLVNTVGQTFAARLCVLRPVEYNPRTAIFQLSPQHFQYTPPDQPPQTELPATLELLEQAAVDTLQTQVADEVLPSPELSCDHACDLSVPLIHQKQPLAVLSIVQCCRQRSWKAEDLRLIEMVAQQAALALSQAKLYQQTQAQAQQLESELEVARQIQFKLLRQTWPAIEGVRIQACCHPAQAVGGDLFEVFVHPRGDIWLAVGDVAGKGVPAALFMASLLSVLRREISQADAYVPAEVIATLNGSLAEDLISNNRFVTMLLARYTPATRELTYASAGQVYPLLWSRQALLAGLEIPQVLKARGVPLGILPVWRGDSETLTLQPGQTLLLLSDGVTDAFLNRTPGQNGLTPAEVASGALPGQGGLWRLIRSYGAGPLDLNQLLAHLQQRTGRQEDDQTLLSLEIL